MMGIIYSKLDEAGANMARFLIDNYNFSKTAKDKFASYGNKIAKIYQIDSLPFEAKFVDSFDCDIAIFLSRHQSEAGVAAFTTHSLGNWNNKASIGGMGKELTNAAPVAMLAALSAISKLSADVEKTYEATHHGPLLRKPSFFVEIGGNEKIIKSKEAAEKVASSVFGILEDIKEEKVEYKKVVIGIGGGHYPEKFSKLAVEQGYAFSHIMPKYAIVNDDGSNNLDVLWQTLDRSTHEPEAAVIDWKSLNTSLRGETIKKLDEIGLQYERV